MPATTLHLHTAFRIAPVDERVFGGFLEHMGRAVYDGVVDPETAAPRPAVLDALRPLQYTAMRWPGGNFVSGYHWLDGVGPVAQRPTVRELAWQSIEPNRFGTDEFISVCRAMQWTPMFSVNLGTGTPEEARNWVEYCNGEPGTKYADMRVAYGHRDPFGVKLWCLGNEMDGPWQLGHVPAEHYAIRAQQAAKMMRDTDPTAELVVCGSCSMGLPTYMTWDRQVLEHVGDFADYISLHRYVTNDAGDTPDFLAVTNSIDRQIEDMDAACRMVQAKRRSKKRAYLCFDEWNVWYKNREMNGRGKFAPHLIEEVYNLEDALVAAGFLMSFIRHADVVKIANIAQIVNVIAPILTEGEKVLRQSIYWPIQMMSARRQGESLRVTVDGPRYEGKTHGSVAFIDAAAVLDGRRLSVFASNRDPAAAHDLTIAVADAKVAKVISAEIVTGPDAKAHNTFDKPDVVGMHKLDGISLAGGKATLQLPPLSFAAATVELG
jgi:alpha-N-arabinofuranosidase